MALVTGPDMEMLARFPEPPGSVQMALDQLAVLRRGDPKEIEAAGQDLHDLPRPWDPSTCAARLRASVWAWCDDVADWVNHEYAWRPSLMIPPCWPRHPHIARELPVLACQRWAAGLATGYEVLDDWHRYSLPLFLDRMFSRLGESTCRTGKHQDWPADSRHALYSSQAEIDGRLAVFRADTHAASTPRA